MDIVYRTYAQELSMAIFKEFNLNFGIFKKEGCLNDYQAKPS